MDSDKKVVNEEASHSALTGAHRPIFADADDLRAVVAEVRAGHRRCVARDLLGIWAHLCGVHLTILCAAWTFLYVALTGSYVALTVLCVALTVLYVAGGPGAGASSLKCARVTDDVWPATGLGFGVWGLGFGVWGLGFKIWDLEFGLSAGRRFKTFRTRAFSRCTPIPDCTRQRVRRCLQHVRCCLQRRRRCLQLVCECGHHFHGGRGLVSDLISKHL